MLVRKAAVAGSFYPAEPAELRSLIKDSYLHPLGPRSLPPASYASDSVVACVCPHAGYVYSGPVAAHSYLHVSSLREPELVVIVGPNHYGVGSGVATFKGGVWETPLGAVRVDEEAADRIVSLTGIVDYDVAAHKMEHSLEVQLPFLQELYHDALRVLPISLGFQDPDTARAIGRGVADLARERRAVVVASSDLTHYEPAADARVKDLALVEKIEALDVRAFYGALERNHVSACGYGAIAAVMEAAKTLGFKRGELLKYASSGDTSGDMSAVVGYASLRFV